MKNNDSLSSRNTYYGEQQREEFRQQELKGELNPAIFYQNQQRKGMTNSGSKRDMVDKLKLEFDSKDVHSEQRELEAQAQIRNLNF